MLVLDRYKTTYWTPNSYLAPSGMSLGCAIQNGLTGYHGLGDILSDIMSSVGDIGAGTTAQDASTVSSFISNVGSISPHLAANQIVQSLENPFWTHLSQIVDPKDASIQNGTATAMSVQSARNAVYKL